MKLRWQPINPDDQAYPFGLGSHVFTAFQSAGTWQQNEIQPATFFVRGLFRFYAAGWVRL